MGRTQQQRFLPVCGEHGAGTRKENPGALPGQLPGFFFQFPVPGTVSERSHGTGQGRLEFSVGAQFNLAQPDLQYP